MISDNDSLLKSMLDQRKNTPSLIHPCHISIGVDEALIQNDPPKIDIFLES